MGSHASGSPEGPTEGPGMEDVRGERLLYGGAVARCCFPNPSATDPADLSSHLIQSLLPSRIHPASTLYPESASGVGMQHSPRNVHTKGAFGLSEKWRPGRSLRAERCCTRG